MTLDGFLAAFAREALGAPRGWRLIDTMWTVRGTAMRMLTGWMGHTDSPLTFVADRAGCPRSQNRCALDWPRAAYFLGLGARDTQAILRAQDGRWYHDRSVRLALLMGANLR